MNLDGTFTVEKRGEAKDRDLGQNLEAAVKESADRALEESPDPGNVADPEDIKTQRLIHFQLSILSNFCKYVQISKWEKKKFYHLRV